MSKIRRCQLRSRSEVRIGGTILELLTLLGATVLGLLLLLPALAKARNDAQLQTCQDKMLQLTVATYISRSEE